LPSNIDAVTDSRPSQQSISPDCKPHNSQLSSETSAEVITKQLCTVVMSDAAVITDASDVPQGIENNCEVTPVKEDPPKPMRSYELSAEYGGFFVPSAPTVAAAVNPVQTVDDDVGCTDYTDLQPLEPLNGAGLSQARTGSVSGLRHAGTGVGLGGGFYEEPWDLSTTRRGLTERWRQTKQTKDVGIMAVLDSAADRPAELYAQPHKGVERAQRRIADTSEMRSTGPSYGILCQRVAENGMLAPVLIRDVGSSGCQTVPQHLDLRPIEDYDVPWDQKKSICKTGQ
jgi:hypothetical protein